MLGKIWNFLKGLVFGRGSSPIGPGKVVVSVSFKMRRGKVYKVYTYSDGSKKEVLQNASDPTGVDDFLDDVGP